MKDFQCSSCGQESKPAAHCPHCGATQPQWAEHLAEIERSIAEMKAREAAIAAEQRQIAQKMQAALFQRDILAHAGEDGLNKSTRPHRVLRRRTRRPSGPANAAGATQSSKAAAAPPAQGTGPSGRTGTPKTPPGKAGAGRPGADAPGRADTGPADAGRPRTPKVGPDPADPRRTGAGRGSRVPRQGTVPPPQDPPGRPDAIWLDADDPENPPEASSREVQNIPLGLGALLLGVAAVVFAILAGTSMDALGRLGILLLATVVMLLVPPVLARRGLTSTAETISVVGLLLLPLAGYALWSVDRIGSGGFPGALFVALVFGGTTATALLYARFTGLRAPRFATVLAAQPILPALAYGWVDGAVGWALVLTAVAGLDLWLARSPLTVERPVRRDLPEPVRDRRAEGRPETAPEERAEVLGGHQSGRVPRPARTGRPTGPARPVPGLARLTWVLHAIAVVLALALAVIGLLRAATVPVAVGAGAALLLAAALCLAGTLAARRPPLPDVGAGVVTLAVIVAASRIAAVALPGRAVLVIAAVIAVTGLAVRAVPEAARRGPQLAAATALTVCGLVVAFDAVRAGLAPVWAALPAWAADLDRYPRVLADATGAAAWQLPLAALLLTVAAVLALPPQIRREFAVVGVALTALAVPASFGLGWAAAPWPMVLAAVGIGLAGLSARTERSALVHVVTAALIGAVGTGAALARPAVTSVVLLVLCLAGIAAALVPRFRMAPAGAETVTAWAAGGAAFALPGSVAAFVTATVPVDPTPTPASLREMTVPVLAASFLAVCVTLGHAALVQVSQRHVPTPLATGTGLGALVVCAAAFVAPGTTAADLWLCGLVLVATALVVLTPMIDARRPSDVSLDAADLALAAVTTALVATMVRVAAVVTPGGQLVVAAILVLVVAVTARALPQQWRRGPVLGVAVGGVLIGLIAGWSTVRSGLAVLATPGPIWAGDLSGWPMVPAGGAWQAPAALALLGVAAAVLLPPPWKYDVSGAAAVLATIGVPAALGLSWWSPVVVGAMVATCYAMAAVAAVDPRAALSRATMAGILGLYAAAAGLPRPWSTALALGAVVLICVTVAAVARVVAAGQVDIEAEGLPPHLAQVGGAAAGAALLAAPGAVAALAAGFGDSPQVVVTSALAATSLGLALVGAFRRRIPQYLPYTSAGVAVGATVSALAAVFAGLPFGVYAAVAGLLGVLAELLRVATDPPVETARPLHRWSMLVDGALRRGPDDGTPRWRVNPAAGALAAAAVPVVLAVVSVAPALLAALVQPYRTLTRIWQGPPPELLTPPPGAVNATHVLTALLLTGTAALAATGFTAGRWSRAVPVVLPGVAVTLLITPVSLGRPWPAGAAAGLVVFALTMLALALARPPSRLERARSLRSARVLAFVIGLAAGGAGLAGALATQGLTLQALGGGAAVGTVAALFGRTQRARILGWLFASLKAQLFVLTLGLVVGLAPVWSAFGVLAVGAALQVVAATLPRLRRPQAYREAATVEWSGYAAALIALALAFDSPRHIAALLAAWGALLGLAATRPRRRPVERRILFWGVVLCEITAWWILMRVAEVALPEAYTLPFAVLALLVGLLELRQRPDLSSWVAYGPALVAAFLPTCAIVLATDSSMLRQVLLLLGAVAVLIFGSVRQQQAPVVIGAVVTVVVAVHALFSLGPWLVLVPVGLVLLVLGASNERRRRAQERLQTALRGMR